MSATILQINYKLNMPKADYLARASQVAQPIAAVAGLQWKIWLVNETEGEAGGIYLFDSPESAQHFLEGPIIATLKANPQFSDVTAKLFEAAEAVSQITRGPIGLAHPA
jgi:hypothetical protein